jgi:hypothetical protein
MKADEVSVDEVKPAVMKADEVKPDVVETIINKSFKYNFSEMNENIERALSGLTPEILGNLSQGNWTTCSGDCLRILNKYMQQEINSTAYMLRLFSKSILGDKSKLQFSTLPNKSMSDLLKNHNVDDEMNGIWKNDQKNITIQAPVTPFPRLIMGFGPSASGKTYCAKTVLEMMQEADSSFPDLFISIDGGLYREASVVYQLIVRAIRETTKLKGLKNLVYSGFKIPVFQKSMFDSDTIKASVMEYLNTQRSQKFSLYVPETLSNCYITLASRCQSKYYQKYIDYTRDYKNWVGLMIYQHQTRKKCTFDEKYKCKGCEESGESREDTEGKQYSGNAWSTSYAAGKKAIMTAPKYRFIIHNTGGRTHEEEGATTVPNIITFEDYSTEKIKKIETYIADKQKWNYVYKTASTPPDEKTGAKTDEKTDERPVKNYPSKQDIQKDIDNAIELLKYIIATQQKIVVSQMNPPSAKHAKDNNFEISDVYKKNNDRVSVSNPMRRFQGGATVDDIFDDMSRKLPSDVNRTFYEFIKNKFLSTNPTDTDPSILLNDFQKYIKTYISNEKSKIAEYNLLELGVNILSKISSKPTSTSTPPFDENAHVKALLEIALKIAFPQESYKLPEFTIPELIILPEPERRIIGVDSQLNETVPEHTDEKGELVSEIKTESNSDVQVTKWDEKRISLPTEYEVRIESNASGSDYNQIIENITKTTDKVVNAQPL